MHAVERLTRKGLFPKMDALMEIDDLKEPVIHSLIQRPTIELT